MDISNDNIESCSKWGNEESETIIENEELENAIIIKYKRVKAGKRTDYIIGDGQVTLWANYLPPHNEIAGRELVPPFICMCATNFFYMVDGMSFYPMKYSIR